jgi:F-type H+-transporting ATPase subunit delta
VAVADEATGVSGLAARYATALFELAHEREALDEVAGDLSTVRGMLEASADLRRMVRSPVIARDAQGRAVAAIAEHAGLGQLVSNFLGLLARNRRLFALQEMIRGFDARLAEHRGEVTAEVASARPLSEAQSREVKATLARALGREVRLRDVVDPSLIGGIMVRVGSRMIDASLKARLQALRLAMKGAH